MLPADLASELAGLALPAWRYCELVGSTNDFALAWGEAGAADGSLVVADEQTAGRGRLDRRWFTPPGAALAFSLVLRPNPAELTCVARFSPLGALAVQQALAVNLNLPAEIKWPNDVLVGRRKVCGILAESTWQGETLTALVLGIGVNITPAAVPPADQLLFPAGCIETALGKPVPRGRCCVKFWKHCWNGGRRYAQTASWQPGRSGWPLKASGLQFQVDLQRHAAAFCWELTHRVTCACKRPTAANSMYRRAIYRCARFSVV